MPLISHNDVGNSSSFFRNVSVRAFHLICFALTIIFIIRLPMTSVFPIPKFHFVKFVRIDTSDYITMETYKPDILPETYFPSI